jgi:membrane protein YqaA with SNARE-associated domain
MGLGSGRGIVPAYFFSKPTKPLTPMQETLMSWLNVLALPEVGLSTVFVVAFISATLLPMGSEAVVFGMVTLQPDWFWVTVLVATAGNTLGGAVSWWMGWGAHLAVDKVRGQRSETQALHWLRRWGPKACLLSWLPVVGDPLCVAAGWMKLPFWPCVAFMAVGKFARYVIMTSALVWAVPTDWLP